MKYKVEYLAGAKQDLDNLVDYLAVECGAYEAAVSLLNEIQQRIMHLADFPYSHPLYMAPMRLPTELRYLPVKSHIVFYTVLEPAHIVEIRRVLHAKRNIAVLM